MEPVWLSVVVLLVVVGGLLLLAFIPRKSDGNNSIDLES
jgi:hypothetical protein